MQSYVEMAPRYSPLYADSIIDTSSTGSSGILGETGVAA